ncbi:DUF6923 family protein [Lyngbya sp. CCY1209]|uniref:DUF6923 family protein n=1 Tax=Lyngbya sp. CCY1209 TaxID=2886103 RepID=UPI002D20FFDB|nr:hypothetical protein [Lyngbya sp. CCY1209]MEB3887132.1 hypothetical protein [Lyngbya sp. CCY1209]
MIWRGCDRIQEQWHYVLATFEEKPAFFQVIDGQLKVLNPLTGNYEDIGNVNLDGSGNGLIYNASGYNSNDNYIYGVVRTGDQSTENTPDIHQLIRIDSEGVIAYVKTDGTTTTNSNDTEIYTPNIQFPFSGDFDTGNNLWVINRGEEDSLLKIEIGTNSITESKVSITDNGDINSDVNNITDIDLTTVFDLVYIQRDAKESFMELAKALVQAD